MIYPANFECRVGFDKIRDEIVGLCSMESARELIAAEGFMMRGATPCKSVCA